MTDERGMEAPGRVSIWLGNFADEIEALDYIESEEGFGRQFGCVRRQSRELVAFEKPTPLRLLLGSFSSACDFLGEAVSLRPNEPPARCAVVAYACDYRSLGFSPRDGQMRFLGVATFGQNGEGYPIYTSDAGQGPALMIETLAERNEKNLHRLSSRVSGRLRVASS